jgi:hypothetical protein
VSNLVTRLLHASPGLSPTADWPALGRAAAATTLIAGATCQVIAFAIVPSFDDTSDRLAWAADHHARAQISKVFDSVAIPFLIGAAIVYVLLARRGAPRLAWTGGILLVMGMVGLAMVNGAETVTLGLSDDARFEPATLGDAVDGMSTPSLITMFLMFLPGVLFGVVITSVALWRSRAVPAVVPLLFLLFLVTDVFLQQGLIAHVIALVGAGWVAVTVLSSRESAVLTSAFL